MEINVGSIIYIIDSKNRSVVPAQINEQVISKTVHDESITHNIELPNGKKVNLESLNSIFFSSLSDVRVYLLEKATEIIETGIKNAEVMAQTQFGNEPTLGPPGDSILLASNATSMEGSDALKVTLDDGQVVNVTVPPEFLSENPDY